MGLFKSFTEGQDFRESMDQFVVLQHALLVLLGSVLASSVHQQILMNLLICLGLSQVLRHCARSNYVSLDHTSGSAAVDKICLCAKMWKNLSLLWELGQSRYTLALLMVTRLPLVAVIKTRKLLFSRRYF